MFTTRPAGRFSRSGRNARRDGQHPAQVDGHRLQVPVERDAQERPADDDAGVVHEHVDRPGGGVELLADGGHLLGRVTSSG